MVIVLVISTMIPFFAVYDSSPSDTAKKIASLFGDKILICTGDGFKLIDLADIETEQKNLPQDHYKCPLCFIAANGHAAALSFRDLSVSSVYNNFIQAVYFSNIPIALSQNNLSDSIPRAPPFSFLA